MSEIPAPERTLRTSAASLGANADALATGDVSLLLRIYSVECAMKARYLNEQLGSPREGTSAIPKGTFGANGHDLDAGRKALKAPASLGPSPTMKAGDRVVHIHEAHQVWRYGIPRQGSAEVDTWLKQVAAWLEDSR